METVDRLAGKAATQIGRVWVWVANRVWVGVAVGDATDLTTDTFRSPLLKSVKNAQFSDKIHHSAARGTSFCAGTGMNIIATYSQSSASSVLRFFFALGGGTNSVEVHRCFDKPYTAVVVPDGTHRAVPCLKSSVGSS